MKKYLILEVNTPDCILEAEDTLGPRCQVDGSYNYNCEKCVHGLTLTAMAQKAALFLNFYIQDWSDPEIIMETALEELIPSVKATQF